MRATPFSWHRRLARAFAVLLAVPLAHAADPKPVPRAQAVPQPYQQISFQRDGAEIARCHFDPALRRPFLFPIIGPAGRSLTRMGHPRDPESHSHHNSVWISHKDVNGVSFWEDSKAKGRIVHQRIETIEDEGDDTASVTTLSNWINEADGKVILTERRRTQVQLLENKEWLLLIDLQFTCKEPATFGKTPFGLIGVRMAKTIGTLDGGGTIRNSEGQVDEKEIFWKPAKWVDYSGPTAPNAIEGITLMDHRANPNHPSIFHVRGDGWMGSSFTHAEPRTLQPGETLRLRYGLYIHAGQPSREQLQARWEQFAKSELMDLPKPTRP